MLGPCNICGFGNGGIKCGFHELYFRIVLIYWEIRVLLAKLFAEVSFSSYKSKE